MIVPFVLLACTPPSVGDRPDLAIPAAEVDEVAEVLGDAPAGTVEEETFFADTGVIEIGIELDEAAIAALQAAPTEYVQGAFTLGGTRYEPVGVRLKGNSTYQWLDGRPAWKVKFDEYVPGQRVRGLERLTLDSNYWDGSMMAETLAYRLWRQSGNPAPRTGYADVSFNGSLYGLYTVVEAMDDGFIEENFPGSEGGLWEMCRSCDFNADCTQYPLQETGTAYDETGLLRACAAAATGEEAQIRAHFDWEHLTRYLALERATNHSDSYSFNRNNYYVYHDPLTDKVSLSPWGADSTFSYSYPPDQEIPCEPGYFNVLSSSPGAWLASWCDANPACRADVDAQVTALAAVIEDEDLAGFARATHDRIADSVAADPRWPWGVDTWEAKAACFQRWIEDRPTQLRDWVEAR